MDLLWRLLFISTFLLLFCINTIMLTLTDAVRPRLLLCLRVIGRCCRWLFSAGEARARCDTDICSPAAAATASHLASSLLIIIIEEAVSLRCLVQPCRLSIPACDKHDDRDGSCKCPPVRADNAAPLVCVHVELFTGHGHSSCNL